MYGRDRLGTKLANSNEMNDNALAGGISGISARLISTPLDVVKIRFQLQEESISKKNAQSKYTGVIQSLRTIVHEEGMSALWKGSVPGLAMYFIFGSVQFSSSAFVIRTLESRYNITTTSPGIHFVSGCYGGGLAAVICQPLDVIRTRFVGQGRNKLYRNLHSAVRLMYLENGLKTFYKGLTPTLILIVPQAGMNFGFYSLYLHIWKSWCSLAPVSVLKGNEGIESLVCGGLAGMSSKTLTLPLDLLKKRLQVQGFESARRDFGQITKYNGVADTFRKILVHEGILGFYKGAVPAILKTSITTSVSFYVYENMLRFLRTKHSLW